MKETCGFTRYCYECDADATHEIDDDAYNATADTRRNEIDSVFITKHACPKHAKCYQRFTGRTAKPLKR